MDQRDRGKGGAVAPPNGVEIRRRDDEGVGARVHGPHLRERGAELRRQRQRDGTGAGADIDRDQTTGRVRFGDGASETTGLAQRDLDHLLRLGARDQHAPIDE